LRGLALAAGAAVALWVGNRCFVKPPANAKAEGLLVEGNAAGQRRGLLLAVAGGLAATANGGLPQPANAGFERLRVAYPPIDRRDNSRCKFASSAMGQANAARDKLLDLRECKMSGDSAADKDIAGALMDRGNFSNVDFQNAIMSKVVAQNATLVGANFKNAVIDRATFDGSNLKGAIFKNTILTGTTFDGADLANADFTDAAIAAFDVKVLCKNPTVKGTNPVTGEDTYDSAGCYNQGLAR